MNYINTKIKALIFDMDGTIVQTDSHWDKATKKYLEQFNVDTSTQEYANLESSLIGGSLQTYAKTIKNRYKLKKTEKQILKEYENIAIKLFEQGVKLVDGFEQFHKQLVIQNIPHCIATNASDLSLEALKKAVNLPHYFKEHIYNISHVNNKMKPAPDLFLYAAKKLNVHPSECLVFEDSLPGFMAAKAAGMRCIAIRSADNLKYLTLAQRTIDNYNKAIEAINLID